MTSSHPARRLVTASLILFVLVLLPWPIGDLFDGPVIQMLMPVSEPLTHLSVSIRPPQRLDSGEAEEVDELLIELSAREERIFYLQRQVDLLQHQLSELTSLYQEDPNVVYLPVRRGSSDGAAGRGSAFSVNAGTRQGVSRGSVAITPYRQLVGRVQHVDTLTSSILPIVHPDTVLSVCIEVGDAGLADDALGSLEADKQGRLVGLFDSSTTFPPGSIVRLCDDDVWGRNNTGLVVGSVEHCEPYPEHSLHQRVFVRPTIDVMRLSEMLLKIPEDRADRSLQGGG